MKVGWRFDRGQAAVGETVPILCAFMLDDEHGGKSQIEFVIPESAAQELLANLATAAKPPSDITVASSMRDLKGAS